MRDLQAGVAKICVNRWAISYCLDECTEQDLNRYSNIGEVVEEFCRFLERAATFKMNRGQSVNLFEMVHDEWSRFAPKLKV